MGKTEDEDEQINNHEHHEDRRGGGKSRNDAEHSGRALTLIALRAKDAAP